VIPLDRGDSSAVDNVFTSGDRCGKVGTQESDQFSHFLGPTGTSNRNGFDVFIKLSSIIELSTDNPTSVGFRLEFFSVMRSGIFGRFHKKSPQGYGCEYRGVTAWILC
jgi:hypothetical protein